MNPTATVSRIVQFTIVVSLLLAGSAQARTIHRAVRPVAPPSQPEYAEGGYADKASVAQGETITFHIASGVSPFTASIINQASFQTTLTTIPNLTSVPQSCTGRYNTGCGWAATTTLGIPASWPSGYYAVKFPTTQGDRWIPFVVRSAIPGRTTSILVISPTNTWQAYNSFGGASLYPEDLSVPGSPRASQVSYDRPYDEDSGFGQYFDWERYLTDFLTGEGRRFDVAADPDLEDSTLLGHYNLVIIAGHSEYWTLSARRNLEAYSNNGGHIAILTGNTMSWQVRLSDDHRIVTGYKDASLDPLTGHDNSRVTVHFFDEPVRNPENSITGLSFRYAGYANKVDTPNVFLLKPRGQRGGFTATSTDSWIFENTGISPGTTFGYNALGLEVDGTLFNCSASGLILGPDGSDGTPRNFHILAYAPSTDGHATMGIYTNPSGGAVFNAASQNWTVALFDDPAIQQMTDNILDRLSTGQPLPYDPVMTTVLMEDRFNCPLDSPTMLPGWHGTIAGAQVNRGCAYEGPGGLQLKGADDVAIARTFATTQSLNHVEARLYVNADGLAMRGNDPMPLVELVDRHDRTSAEAALIEFAVEDGVRKVRVSKRDSTRAFATTPWLTMASGWHQLDLSWHSPGAVTLRMDGGTPLAMTNADATQRVNELVLAYPGSAMDDGSSLCVDGVAVGLTTPDALPAIR